VILVAFPFDAAGAGLGVASVVIGIVLNALFLWLSAKIFKLRDKTFTTPLVIALIAGVVGFVLGFLPVIRGIISLLVTIVLTVWLVKTKYRVDWGKAILVWLVAFVFGVVAGIIIAALFYGSMMAGFGMMGIMR
jgi:hypothetical protein